jgi:hypothetical protein
MGRDRRHASSTDRTERSRVRVRHEAAWTPAALNVRARLGKARCIGKRAVSSSAVPGDAGRRYGAVRARPVPGWCDVAARLERGQTFRTRQL